MPVEALDESATVGVTELVGDDVWRQSALHQQRRARMAQLVELDLVAAGPALADGAEVVGERALRESLAAAGVEQVRTVKSGRHVGEYLERRWRHCDDPGAAVLRQLLATLAIEREANHDLSPRDVEIVAANAAQLARAATDVAEEDQCGAELRSVLTAERVNGGIGERADVRLA